MTASTDDTIEDLIDHVDLWGHGLYSRLYAMRAGERAAEHVRAMSVAKLRIERRASPVRAALRERLALTPTEEACVWLLAAIALDPELREPLVQLGAPDGRPTLDTLRRIVYGERPSRAALAELAQTGTLRRLDIIERTDAGDTHESRHTWALGRRVLAFLHGHDAIDPALAGIARAADDGPAVDRLAIAPSIVAIARDAMSVDKPSVTLAIGASGLGRRTLLGAVAREAGHRVLEIDASALARDATAARRQLVAIERELRLTGRLPLVVRVDALADDVAPLATALPGRILATCGPSRPVLRWNRPVVAVEMAPPSSDQRARLWRAALGQGTQSDADYLAGLYPFAPAVIAGVGAAANARAVGRKLTPDDISAAVRVTLDDRLGAFAQRVTVTQTWDDLVLPADQRTAVAELAARVRGRRRVYEEWGFARKMAKGLGVSALFSGPPGTGKTMVAALIARELGLELYQVDMARITSKWVGETEKQLAAVFDAAEAGHAVLLFDEADALFGKRTETKSSNDRYANLETNFLLQRLETFTGVCILTSNHEVAIDPAFLRRLSLHLRFEVPDRRERARLWRAMLPADAPAAAVDAGDLADRFEMSGGYIRNAVLRAAFLAADEGTEITTALLERAARLEFEGMGRVAA